MAYAQLARSLSGGAPPDAGEIAGKSNLQLYEALVARFGGPATAEELSQRHFRLVCQLLEEYRVGPMPGLEEALDALRRRGIPFGVVSSSWRWYVEHCLRELGMYEDAAVIVTGSDGLPLKPAPAPYQAAARVFRPAPPGAVLAVGNAPTALLRLEALIADGLRPLRRGGGSGLRGGIQPRLGGAGSVPGPVAAEQPVRAARPAGRQLNQSDFCLHN